MNSRSLLGKVLVGAIITLAAATAFVQVSPALAQTGPTEGQDGGFVICGRTADDPCQIGDLFAAFVIIINYLITMAGFVAVLAIVYAGFMMVYSQGQEQLKAAKGRLTGAVIGLVLVAAAFILINSLFSGRFSIGVCDGSSILTHPAEYINKAKDLNSCK